MQSLKQQNNSLKCPFLRDERIGEFYNEYKDVAEINLSQAARLHFKYVYNEEINKNKVGQISSFFKWKGWKFYRKRVGDEVYKIYVNPNSNLQVTRKLHENSFSLIENEPLIKLENHVSVNGTLTREAIAYRRKVYESMPETLKTLIDFHLTQLITEVKITGKKNKFLRLAEIEKYLEMVSYFKFPRSVICYFMAINEVTSFDSLLPNPSYARFYLPFDNVSYIKELLAEYEPITENQEYQELRKVWESQLTINDEGSYYGW